MKILLLTEFLPDSAPRVFTGGVERRTVRLVEFLKKKHAVTVINRTSSYSFNTWKTFFQRVYFLKTELWDLLWTHKRFDIVEGTNALTYILAFLWARRTGAKAVAWVPDLFDRMSSKSLGPINGMAIRFAEWISMKLSWNGIIALSWTTREKILKAGQPRERIIVVYGGVHIDTKIQKSEINQKFTTPTIVCISRLVQYKRVEDAILAVYLVKQCIPDIQLFIVGTGPERVQLEKFVIITHLQDAVHFLGRVSETEKNNLLSYSHIHVLPSGFEGFGLVTVEALASGTPVVNSDIQVHHEILQGESGGLLYPVGDYVELSHAIQQLLDDTKLYNQKVVEGLKLVTKYDWDKVNRKTEHFYQRLLSH